MEVKLQDLSVVIILQKKQTTIYQMT